MPEPHSVEAELRFIAQGLRAHLEWLETSGAEGCLPIDDTWLEERRQQYRDLSPTDEDLAQLIWEGDRGIAGPEPPASDSSSGLPQHSPVLTPAPDSEHSGKTPAVAAPAISPPQRPVAQTTSLPVPAVTVSAPRVELPASLSVLQEEVRTCTRCSLHEQRTQTVFSRGNGASRVCFIGEGPGADEDRLGEPFVGAAGQLLDKMIGAMGIARDDVYVCNVVKCRPPKNRKPAPEEMAACRGYLEQQLSLVQPAIIVALGATAVHGLLGLSLGITRLRGQWRLYKGTIPVMPTFHPAYLLRQPSAKREVWSDLQQVMQELARL